MPYEYTEWEPEPEAKPASARGGGPPRNHTGVGLLEPLGPPAPRAIPLGAWRLLLRILAAAILVATIASLLMLLSRGSPR